MSYVVDPRITKISAHVALASKHLLSTAPNIGVGNLAESLDEAIKGLALAQEVIADLDAKLQKKG